MVEMSRIDGIYSQGIPQSPTVNASENDIKNIFDKYKKVGKKAGTTQSSDKETNVVKTENASYVYNGQKVKGKLQTLSDGTLKFVTKSGHADVEYKFLTKADFDARRPSQEVIKAFGRVVVSTNYNYNENGTIARKESYRNDKLSSITVNDKNGNLVSKESYKDGKLDSKISSEDIDKNTRKFTKTDANGKVIERAENKYTDEGKISEAKIMRPDGSLKSYTKYNKGKKTEYISYYDNRQVAKVIHYNKKGGITSIDRYDEKGNLVNSSKADFEPDGKFGPSSQVGEGDCYLLASINSIKELSDGDKLLNNLVSIKKGADGKKVYTVTLPGASIAAQSLMQNNNIPSDKMFITGTYTFTQDELNEILEKQGTAYSVGDADVILLEVAFEKYRKEVLQTVKANNLTDSTASIAGIQTGQNTSNILEGGRGGYDAVFILTGKTSQVYQNYKHNNGLINKPDGSVIAYTPSSSRNNQNVKAAAVGVSEIDGSVRNTRPELTKMLDKLMNDEKDGKKDYVGVAGFVLYDEHGKKLGGHAYTIKSVSATEVVLINPWNPEKDIVMSRSDFEACVQQVDISDSSSTRKPQVVRGGTQQTSQGQHPTIKPPKRRPTPSKPDPGLSPLRSDRNNLLEYLVRKLKK